MKTLANCKPSEFLVQTNKIRKAAVKWLTATDILNIRKNLPTIPEDASEEEKKKLLQEQGRKNLSKILDSVLEEHPKETLEMLALCSFVSPENVDDYDMSFYLAVINDLLTSESVINFFTLLVRLESKDISNTAKA